MTATILDRFTMTRTDEPDHPELVEGVHAYAWELTWDDTPVLAGEVAPGGTPDVETIRNTIAVAVLLEWLCDPSMAATRPGRASSPPVAMSERRKR